MSTQSKDGKWLVIVQNDKYTASDFAHLLGNIEGLCALKKFQNMASIVQLLVYVCIIMMMMKF